MKTSTFVAVALMILAAAQTYVTKFPAEPREGTPPVFYRDVLPILQQYCQSCHRTGQIAPMPLVTYDDVRSRANEIAIAVSKRKMPPWFADPRFGHFSNDPSLTPDQIQKIVAWAGADAPAGNLKDAPPPRDWVPGWNISQPDVIVKMPRPVVLPAQGDVEYTYEIVPTGFAQDTWVQMSEIRPAARENVHHAVVYIRAPDSKWLRHAPLGTPFTASDRTDEDSHRGAHWTDSDILLVYAPGSSPDLWPAGMAKFVPAGSDLVFQLHYTTHGHAKTDQTSIGIVLAKKPPAQRVITLQLTNDHFVIPPGVDDYRVEAHGTLPNDATVLSFFPHMHLRGKQFDFNIIGANGRIETLLRVNYDFYWQLSYRLAEPRMLKAETMLQAVALYDNSRNNLHNPDPDASVRWGDQTYDEMMVGFFDVAVRADVDKWKYFMRSDEPPEKP
jgi:hypothetical protein